MQKPATWTKCLYECSLLNYVVVMHDEILCVWTNARVQEIAWKQNGNNLCINRSSRKSNTKRRELGIPTIGPPCPEHQKTDRTMGYCCRSQASPKRQNVYLGSAPASRRRKRAPRPENITPTNWANCFGTPERKRALVLSPHSPMPTSICMH